MGIGTSPSYKLDVAGSGNFSTSTAGGIELSLGNSTMTSTNKRLRLIQDNASSVTRFSNNGDSVHYMTFQMDTGNIGIGLTSPSEKLHVLGNLRVQGSTDCTLGNGAGGTNCSSDARLKENIKPIPYALDKVISLQGGEFDWNQKSLSYGRHDIGVIAQDVEKVFPTAVMTDKNSGYKKVDYAVLVAPVIQAIKELYAKVTGQDRELASVKQEVSELRKENEALKAYLCAKDPTAPICK